MSIDDATFDLAKKINKCMSTADINLKIKIVRNYLLKLSRNYNNQMVYLISVSSTVVFILLRSF